MSWATWPTAGPPMPGVVGAPPMQTALLQGAVNSAPAVLPPGATAAIPAGMQYSPEQWAQMQQQNWQQWAQWQQQYQQWHQQYGAEYQKSMNALAVTAPVSAAAPNTAVPPPPPNESKPPPPPPPDDSAQPGQYNVMPPKIGSGYNTAPPNQQYNTAPPQNFRQQPTQPNHWQNANNKRPLNQGDDYDGGKRQMLDNPGQWNKPAQQPKATGQSWQNQPPPSAQTHAQKVLNLEELTIAEKKFDKEFAAWEAQFNKWKDQNANHPDKTQYMEYEKKWESWRNSLLERREQMRKKRVALQTSMAQSAPASKPAAIVQPQQSFNQPPPIQQGAFSHQKNQAPPVNIFNKPPPTQNNEPLSFKPPKGYPGEEAHQQEVGDDFLKSSTSAAEGIPGLDLVKESQNQELPEDEPVEAVVVENTSTPDGAKGPDLDAISKGINTILGDSKLMNMLSMVSQNQSFPAGNKTNTQTQMLNQPLPPHQSAPKSTPPIPSLLSMPLQRPPPVDQSNQNYDDFPDQYGPGQREVVHNFDDQTRMSFSNGPNDQDIGYGNNFNNGPPSIPGRPGKNDSFIREDNRNNFGDNFNSGPPPGPGRLGRNDRDDNRNNFGDSFNSGPFADTGRLGRNDGFNREGNQNNFDDDFNNGPPPGPGRRGGNDDFNREDDHSNFGANFNDNRRDKFDRIDSFKGPSGNRPGFNQGGDYDNKGRGFNRNDSFDNDRNRNDNFNNRRGNLNNRGGKFDRYDDYDNYKDDYDDRSNDNYNDYNQEYDEGFNNQNKDYNNQKGFQDQKGRGDEYNEEGWYEEDEYDKYHDMFNEGDQAPEVPLIAAAPMLPLRPPPIMGLSIKPPPAPQPMEVVPPVDNEPLFVPEVVVDYEHKSLKEPEPEISLEPIHMFDYRHKPVNRIPYPQRPIWLQGTLRNTRQFDPLGGGRFSGADRQFDLLGGAMVTRDIKNDRYPQEDRFDRRPTFEGRGPRPNDDKYRDYRDKYDDKAAVNRGPQRDKEFSRDKERNRYDNSPRPREQESRDRDRGYDNRAQNRGYQDKSEKPYVEKKLDLEDLSDDEWKDEDTNNQSSNKEVLRFSPPQQNDKPYPEVSFRGNSSNPANNTPVNQNITLEDLIVAPGRYKRPARIVIILRGPPGSGKTYLARLIKDREVENGGSAPRILSLDDYFMIEQEREVFEDGKPLMVKEMVYEYEAEMEESYRQSLTKAFKKTVTDGYFNFIVVDNVNQKVKYFGEMWSYAKQNGFQVYICQLDLDPQLCTRRNIHNRSQSDIEDCIAGWEPTPTHHPLVDATNFLQSSGSITEVEMEDVQSQDDVDEAAEDHVRSKWDTFDCSVNNLARLDGVSKPLRHSRTMEEYLQLDDEWEEPSAPTKPGQKRVRWADLEEQREQKKMKAIGFVVGQTDWNRMMDPTNGGRALTQTKYIARVRRS